MEQKGFILDQKLGYFRAGGVNVMAFDDIYPVGHQAGVSVLMNGSRIATNGDIRFEQTPGQWQPVPLQEDRKLDAENNAIVTRLSYPDLGQHLTGFNPLIYPDCDMTYTVTAKGVEDGVIVTVDLDKPIDKKFAGKLCFNLELFPGDLMGKPYLCDDKQGIFPTQANGPTFAQRSNYEFSGHEHTEGKASREALTGDHKQGYNPMIADDLIALPYAVGHSFTVNPDDDLHRFTVSCEKGLIRLYDGRMNHNNGWFVLSVELPENETKEALVLKIEPYVKEDWMYAPVVQVSQVGYFPKQTKVAIVELDGRDDSCGNAALCKLTKNGYVAVKTLEGKKWGKFLRYNYLKFDFTDAADEGMYKIVYGASESAPFRIAEDVFDRGVWQPVLEYFLPIQMCHMRINEKYRVWHGLCHNDDAVMAPVDYNHIDGYAQGPSTLCKYKPGEQVPGLNVGGWHDAGDWDLRVESQAGECYILSLAYEEFGVDYDVTTIDQGSKVTEIHQPDGKNDILQQIEHGMLSVDGAYESMGRLYRGIITGSLRDYVLLGDGANMTDNLPQTGDERWVFTEDNPERELTTAAQMAASARVLKGFNDDLSAKCLKAAKELYEITRVEGSSEGAKIHAAAELFLTTKEEKYKAFLLSEKDYIEKNISDLGWIVCRVVKALDDDAFTAFVRNAMLSIKEEYVTLSAETPYGIPYRPYIWGAGWDIQTIGFKYYFIQKAFPEIFDPEMMLNALNFVLGCHPGSNTCSFASGVGANSAIPGYGFNRADWSFIPGGVISGTALIRPDFPELLRFPFLWQQTEYVLGGGSSHYMFLVLAALKLFKKA